MFTACGLCFVRRATTRLHPLARLGLAEAATADSSSSILEHWVSQPNIQPYRWTHQTGLLESTMNDKHHHAWRLRFLAYNGAKRKVRNL